MHFGLRNAPVIFQYMENDIFGDFSDVFTIMYQDNIFIYSKTQEEHNVHVCQVLQRLQEYGLYAKLEKCKFDENQVENVRYVVSHEGISMVPFKIKKVLDWQTSRSICDVQCFLGFAYFYRKFIKNYLKIMMSLTELTQKNKPFT
jgi:hypothetical protein